MTIYAHHRPTAFFGFGFSSFQTFACGEVTPPLALRVHVFGAPAPLASWPVRLIPTRISGTLRTSTHIIAHYRTPSHTIKLHHHTASYIAKQPHTHFSGLMVCPHVDLRFIFTEQSCTSLGSEI